MSQQNKEYIIWLSKDGESEPERVVKTEEELTQQDYNLFLANLLDTFNRCPPRTKLEFFIKAGEDVEFI